DFPKLMFQKKIPAADKSGGAGVQPALLVDSARAVVVPIAVEEQRASHQDLAGVLAAGAGDFAGEALHRAPDGVGFLDLRALQVADAGFGAAKEAQKADLGALQDLI